MKLIDISNQEIANIDNCNTEPIHIPGAIQPHGVLLAIDEKMVICCCSENCADVFEQQPSQILNRQLPDVSNEIAEKISPIIREAVFPAKPFRLQYHHKQWDVFVHLSNDLYLVEFEEYVESTYDYEDIFDHTEKFVAHIERSRSLQELCQRIAEQTRNITGYDRVMIYRFDKNYNGEVFAERKKDGLEPYLNLHYPHTDIPVQARELYLRNLLRMIADVDYKPVSLFVPEQAEVKQLDLSDSVLRSVSPIHIQYLKNMHVGATLTISLVMDGRLWGLITCHHSEPKHLSFLQRKAALLQGHFLTSQIKVRQVAEEYEIYTNIEAHLQQLLNALQQDGDFELKFESLRSLLSVANASGVAILHRGRIYEKGLVPSVDKIEKLFQWLAVNTSSLQFSTSHLSSFYPDAEKITRYASGILYNKLGDPRKDAIIWFREELEKTINWAGDPNEAIRKSASNMLTPRSSFALYKEVVKAQSREWKISECNAATRFSNALQNQFHLEYLRQEDAQQKILNEKLQKANMELSNINWITTHDLKEPLRKILLFASRLMSEDEKVLTESIISSVTKIQASAVRMQNLVDDITSYSLIDDKNTAFVETDLNLVLNDVLAQYEDDFLALKANVLVEHLPIMSAIPYQMKQLFINLIGNSLKFAKPNEPIQIEISCTKAIGYISTHPLLKDRKSYYLIKVKDNGIGFDSETYGQKVFEIFYRLNDRDAYTGTGIGLAICKRIVENHGGLITVDGKTGVGTTFQIYFPV